MKTPTIVHEVQMDPMGSLRLAVVKRDDGLYEEVEIRRRATWGGNDRVSRDEAIASTNQEARARRLDRRTK